MVESLFGYLSLVLGFVSLSLSMLIFVGLWANRKKQVNVDNVIITVVFAMCVMGLAFLFGWIGVHAI